MKKIVIALLSVFCISACVSTSEYEEIEASLRKTIREKEYIISELEDEKSSLQSQVEDLEDEVSSLRSTIEDIEFDVSNAISELEHARSWALMEEPYWAHTSINNAIFTLEAISFE